MDRHGKNWSFLLEELPRLRAEGVIDDTAEAGLRKYCEKELRAVSGGNYFAPALAVVGAVLVGGGIILLIGYNWDMFPKSVRIAISFAPLFFALILSLITLIGGKSRAWRETSAVLTAAGNVTAAAMISHIYHLPGSLNEFMMLILLTSAPLLFIFDSRALALLYAVGVFMTTGDGFRDPSATLWMNLLPPAILLTCLGLLMRREGGGAVFARCICLLPAFFLLLQYGENGSSGMLAVCLAVLMMLLGAELREKGVPLSGNPWLVCSFLLLTVVMCAGSFDMELFRAKNLCPGDNLLPTPGWTVIGIMLAGCAALLIRAAKRKRLDAPKFLLMLLLIVAVQGAVFSRFRWDFIPIRLELIAFTAVFSVSLLRRGVRENSRAVFNAGLLMLGGLMLCRFFDDTGMLERAAGFILLGIGFLAANVIFNRRTAAAKEVRHE